MRQVSPHSSRAWGDVPRWGAVAMHGHLWSPCIFPPVLQEHVSHAQQPWASSQAPSV